MGVDDDGLAFRIDFLETLETRFGHVARGVVETDDHQIVEFQNLDGFIAVDGFFQFVDFLCVTSCEPPRGDIMVGAGVHIGDGEFVHAFLQGADAGERAEIADIAAEKDGVRSGFIEDFGHHLPVFERGQAVVRISERLVNTRLDDIHALFFHFGEVVRDDMEIRDPEEGVVLFQAIEFDFYGFKGQSELGGGCFVDIQRCLFQFHWLILSILSFLRFS